MRMILQIIISNGILDLVTGILAKISLGTGIWAKFRLGTGIWYPTSRPSLKVGPHVKFFFKGLITHLLKNEWALPNFVRRDGFIQPDECFH